MSQGSKLFELICDVHRFILFNRGVVENAPLQVYHSALIFSPSRSLTRVTFKNEEPKWVTAKSAIDSTWGACLQTLEGHSYSINSVVFSPDGTHIASGSDDGTVRIWDAGNGGCLHTLQGHSSLIESVVFSPDGTRIASGSWDGTIRIWDAGNAGCLHTLQGQSGFINSVVFSPDGTRIASGSADDTIQIWDAGNGTCLQILNNFESSTLFDPGTPGNTAWTGTSNIQRICETPQHPTYGLNSYGTWITRNGQNVIWLPPEYRPSTFALTSSTMVIGCRSGRVLIFGFLIT